MGEFKFPESEGLIDVHQPSEKAQLRGLPSLLTPSASLGGWFPKAIPRSDNSLEKLSHC